MILSLTTVMEIFHIALRFRSLSVLNEGFLGVPEPDVPYGTVQIENKVAERFS